jgi:hypothetical protein
MKFFPVSCYFPPPPQIQITLRSTVAPYHPVICGTQFHTRTKQRLPPVLTNPRTMVIRTACFCQWAWCFVISILFLCSTARYKYTDGSSYPSYLTSVCTSWHAGNTDWHSYHGLGKTNEHDSIAYVLRLAKETCHFSAAVNTLLNSHCSIRREWTEHSPPCRDRPNCNPESSANSV